MASGFSCMDALKVAAKTKGAPSDWLSGDFMSKSWPAALTDPNFTPGKKRKAEEGSRHSDVPRTPALVDREEKRAKQSYNTTGRIFSSEQGNTNQLDLAQILRWDSEAILGAADGKRSAGKNTFESPADGDLFVHDLLDLRGEEVSSPKLAPLLAENLAFSRGHAPAKSNLTTTTKPPRPQLKIEFPDANGSPPVQWGVSPRVDGAPTPSGGLAALWADSWAESPTNVDLSGISAMFGQADANHPVSEWW